MLRAGALVLAAGVACQMLRGPGQGVRVGSKVGVAKVAHAFGAPPRFTLG